MNFSKSLLLKAFLVHNSLFVRLGYLYPMLTKLFPLPLYGKTLLIIKINNKFFSKSTNLIVNLYNYLFRFFFLYSVFNEHFPRTLSSGRPKWTRTTDLVLIRHAL